jgi:D-galactarolactone cycloisomerase
MKITDVACHILQCKVDKPFVSARGWVYGTRSSCVVEISTDEGITGWGECYGPSAVARTFIETQYKARVVGKDPFDVEAIWEDLYNRIKDYGTTGMAVSAISGIDIALWDIMGRAVGKPVHKLIGGAYRSEVIPYATGLYFIDMDRLVEEAVEEALAFKNDGFRAIKMKIGLGDLKLDARRVGAVRQAIGPDIKLAVDANHCFSVPNAIKLGRMLEEHDILWFEEPISPEDHDGYIEVTRALDMAVAGGENDFTRWGFRDVIAKKAASRSAARSRRSPAPSASNACRTPGARRSGSRPRCSSWRPCPTSRRHFARCRPCWSSSRRPIRCAITWRWSRSSRRRGS